MQILKAVVVFVIALFLLMSPMASAIREEPSLIGVKREVPSGSNPLYNKHPPQPPPKYGHLIKVKNN
ncbi:hypothetical protein CARUB_v10021668mg [Capsella rubella]|uniref:Transmembrane protein n=1 Tax=Capsella rubella TaxID=81985 RepID=R0GEU4_9BRAS|nr:hypothetical protein CARUB_v10021668mg [Capsella rubella]